MSLASTATGNRNDARSVATRARLIDNTIDALVELGFAKATGVEVCRRSGLTRGALNHHFPDFADLLVDTLEILYARLLGVATHADCGPLERLALASYERVVQPEFKAVIELWLASRNDPEFGARLADAIQQSAALFSPAMVLSKIDGAGLNDAAVDHEVEAAYHTITEALIGIGLGRAVGRGQAMAHEELVLGSLCAMAREYDQAHQPVSPVRHPKKHTVLKHE